MLNMTGGGNGGAGRFESCGIAGRGECAVEIKISGGSLGPYGAGGSALWRLDN